MKKIVLIVFVVLTLTVCVSVSFSNAPDFDVISESKVSDSVVVQELTYDASKFEKHYVHYNDMTKENGLYKFYFEEKKSYILFLSKGTEYKNIEFNVVGNELIVTYESSEKTGFNKPKLLSIKQKDKKAFDTVILKNNGEDDHFQSVVSSMGQ